MRAMKIYWGGDNIIENDKKEIIKISTESIIQELNKHAKEYQALDLNVAGSDDEGSDSEAEVDLLKEEERIGVTDTNPKQKRYSKSISQPPQSRNLRRDSVQSKITRKSYFDES